MGNEGIDEGLEFAFHHLVKLVDGESDAMVADTVLREVVGADFLAAIAGADLRTALLGKRFLLLGLFEFVET